MQIKAIETYVPVMPFASQYFEKYRENIIK